MRYVQGSLTRRGGKKLKKKIRRNTAVERMLTAMLPVVNVHNTADTQRDSKTYQLNFLT